MQRKEEKKKQQICKAAKAEVISKHHTQSNQPAGWDLRMYSVCFLSTQYEPLFLLVHVSNKI